MDDAVFDRITAALGAAVSRRAGVLAAASAALAATSGRMDRAHASRRPRSQGPCGDGSRKDNICTEDSQCCTGICNRKTGETNLDRKGRCRCIRIGGACKADKNCCGGRKCVDKVCGSSTPTPPPPDPCASPTVCASGCPQTTVQAAIDAAAAGSTITIGSGTWPGNLTIDKSLTIVGCGATVINTGFSRTITITGSPTVELRNLTVDGTGTPSADGGGILVTGKLTLSGSTLVTRGSIDDSGGCLRVAPTGPGAQIVMSDSARLDSCYCASKGAGVYLYGETSTMTMSGTASIANCASSGGGTGVYVSGGATLTMTGNSSINTNSSNTSGGGVGVGDGGTIGTFTISAPATVTNNTAGSSGGGVYSFNPSNVISIAAGTVVTNTPDNCAGNSLIC